MERSRIPAARRLASALACAAAASLLLLLLAAAGAAASTARLHPAASAAPGEAERIARHWSSARMAATPPLDAPRGRAGIASPSFLQVAEPTVPPNSVNGRLFVKQGLFSGFCSATAIDSPTRRLVLTAAHCLNTGPLGPRRRSVWSRYLQFVPAYSGGVAPFGAFVARRGALFAHPQWVRFGNPNFDVGAILVGPNSGGELVADAVGGGVEIAFDRSRRQRFSTFGYPHRSRWLQGCRSPSVGEDHLTYRIPGPPTVAIRCRWTPGASGGGWLIEDGEAINGLTSYGKPRDRRHTYGPYFSASTVGRLVKGL